MSKKTLTDTPFVRGKLNETDCSLCKFCTPRDQNVDSLEQRVFSYFINPKGEN